MKNSSLNTQQMLANSIKRDIKKAGHTNYTSKNLNTSYLKSPTDQSQISPMKSINTTRMNANKSAFAEMV